jgi:phosphoglycolate phosphatase
VTPLLLDFDGTLVDSRQDLAQGVNRLLAELGLEPLPLAVVVSFVGRGARSLIRRSIEQADPLGRVPRDETVLRRFLDHYQEVMLDNTVPFPGVAAGLDKLREAGVPMAIISNKPEAPTRTIAQALNLTDYFGAILGGDSTPKKKPSALPLRIAAERLGVPLAGCVMVGDSDVDIEAAAAAGIPGVWCSWGGIHPDRPARADHSATSFADIVGIGLSGL